MGKNPTVTTEKIQRALAESLGATNTAIGEDLLAYIHSMVEACDTLKLLVELVYQEIIRKYSFHLPDTMPTGQWDHRIDPVKTRDRLGDLLCKSASELTAAILIADPAHLDAYTLDTAWNSYVLLTRNGRTTDCCQWLEEAGYTRSLNNGSYYYHFQLRDRQISYGKPDYEAFKNVKSKM